MTDSITDITSEDEETKFFVQFPDGRVFRDPTIVLAHDKLEKIRQGYTCIWCFEPLQEAFPQECPLCRFPVRERQIWMFGRMYAGIDIPPVSVEDRLAEFEEQDAREAHKPKTSIIVP